MTPNFDIFKIESEGNVCWLEAASTIEDAKTKALKLAAQAENGILILDQQTGNKLIVENKSGKAEE